MPRFSLKPDSVFLHGALLLVLSLPYFVNLGQSSIWDANEAFYAETAREMLVSGDYLSPRFNYEIRAQKPPLTYWAVLLSYKLLGVNEFALRIPSALAALGILFFVYATARLLFGPLSGLIAALIAATTPRIFILVRRLPIDILLLFFLTAALFFLVRAIQKGKVQHWVPAYLFASLGFMTKGPIALVIPAGTCILWMLLNRRLRLSDTHPVAGAFVFALIALPWYLLIYAAHGWTYISTFFLSDNLGRFATETLGPGRGPFYYFSVYAIDFFPWSILSAFVIYLLWRNRKDVLSERKLSFGLPLIWCALIFLIFTLSKNKQEYYIAPMYPAAAVILSGVVAAGIARVRKPATRKPSGCSGNPNGVSGNTPQVSFLIWAIPYGSLALLLVLLSLFTPFFLSAFLPDLGSILQWLPTAIFLSGSAFLVFYLIRRTALHCFFALSIHLWIVFLAASFFYVPALESYRPVKTFCRTINAEFREGDQAGFYATAVPSMAFYLQRPIFQESDFGLMLERFQSEERVFCVLSAKHFNSFAEKGATLYILDQRPRFSIRLNSLFKAGYTPEEELLLVSNQSLSESESGTGRHSE